MDQSEFESICPYSDEEAAKAFARISRHPAIPIISKYLYPTQPLNYLKNKISSVSTIDEFQHVVMSEVVQAIVDKGGVEACQPAEDKAEEEPKTKEEK